MNRFLMHHVKLLRAWRALPVVRHLLLVKPGSLGAFTIPALIAIPAGLVISSYLLKIKAEHDPKDIEPVKRQKKQGQSRLSRSHFDKFASVEFQGQFFMTPNDFVDCLVIDMPKPRIKRKVTFQNSSNQRASIFVYIISKLNFPPNHNVLKNRFKKCPQPLPN